MPVRIDSITPGRGRGGDTVVIDGDGFNPVPAANLVNAAGISCNVTVASPTQLTVEINPSVQVGDSNEHIPVSVFNILDSTSDEFPWWSSINLADLPTFVIPPAEPGAEEVARGLQNSNNAIAEAKYWERMACLLELIPNDLVNAQGSLAGMTPQGLAQVSPGLLGELLVSDPQGPQFRPRVPHSLGWGLQLAAANTALTTMAAGGIDSVLTPVATEEVVVQSGVIGVLAIYCRLSASSRVQQVDLLVNGALAFTAEILPGVLGGQTVELSPAVEVLQGDRVALQIRKNTSATAWLGRAYAEVA